jgi:hypothetical protein
MNRVSTEDDNESKGADIDALAPILNDVSKIFSDMMGSTTSWSEDKTGDKQTRLGLFIYICVYMYVYIYVCIYVHIHICIYMFMIKQHWEIYKQGIYVYVYV